MVWFIHVLTMSGGAVAVILRLWGERDDWFARLLIVLMGVPVVLCLQSILLLFMARGVKFTWKFSITLFTTALVIDVLMTVFVIGILKKRKQ